MADYVPALKARMGDWQYYVTVMKMGKIARECRLAEEIRTNNGLDELIQRALQDRVQKEMVPYLLNERQRFYGALVVAVYGGEPEFSPVKVSEHELLDDDERSSYGFGLLRFDGSQIYYALDGQHRLKSIQEALKINPDLSKEDITVIILKHEETPEGLQRTRRLFSTLNRRAKPTSSGMNIAIDEDDCIAIISRRLLKENDILKRIISPTLGSKTLSPTKGNDPFISTLTVLYEVNEILLSAYNEGLEIDKNFKQFRPSNTDLDNYYEFIEQLWMRMLEKCPNFDEVLSGRKNPVALRRRLDVHGQVVLDNMGKPVSGGNVFARPIGQYVIADVLKIAGLQGKSMLDAVDAIMSNIPMDIDQAPWVNVVWNPSAQNIISGGANRTLVATLISQSLGLKINKKIRELKQQYRERIGNQKAGLLPKITWSGRNVNDEPEDLDDDKEHD